MNERIKELAIKARLSYVMTPDKPYIEEDLEKFAQLIIAECLDAVHSTYSDFGSAYPEKLAAGRGALHYGYITIQNRFGLR